MLTIISVEGNHYTFDTADELPDGRIVYSQSQCHKRHGTIIRAIFPGFDNSIELHKFYCSSINRANNPNPVAYALFSNVLAEDGQTLVDVIYEREL